MLSSLVRSSLRLSALLVFSACVGDSAVVTPVADSGVDANVADSSVPNDAVSPVDAGSDAKLPFTPKSLASLALWLDGSVGVTTSSGKVSKWGDQSGKGNDAVQQNAQYQPLLSSKINNRDCLYFNQTGAPVQLTVPSPTGASMSGDFLVMVVFQTTLPTSSVSSLFRSEASGTTDTALEVLPPTLSASFTISGTGKYVAAPQQIFSDQKPHVGGMRKTGTKLEILADGANASVTGLPAGDPSGLFVVGGQLKGAICEVVLATGTIDQTSTDTLMTYLKTKYAIN
ncbi:hypothetical protein BH09MYX1_BH09MYX1_40820 [soil metagenome]